MRRILLPILFLCLFLMPSTVFANNPAKLYFFYSDTCAHCKEASVYLETIPSRYPDVQVIRYEVSHNQENYQLMMDVLDLLDISSRGTPLIVLGSRGMVGFSDSIRLTIEENILYARYNEVRDVVGEIQGTSEYFEEHISETDVLIDLPFWKGANAKGDNMALMTLDLGFFSGIQPAVLLTTIVLCLLFFVLFHMPQISMVPFWIPFVIFFLAFLTNGNILTFSSTSYIVFFILCVLCVLFAIFCYRFRNHSFVSKYFSFSSVSVQKGTAIFLATFACFLVCLFFSMRTENVLIYQRLFIFRSISGFSSYLYAILFMVSFLIPSFVLYIFFSFLAKKKKLVRK